MENMSTNPSENAILAAIKQMPVPELERLVDQVIAIRAERVAPHLSIDESLLLARINQGLSVTERSRLRELIDKRDSVTLETAEWQELTALTDKLELLHADRLAAIAELARLRGITFDEVMAQLDIHLPDHV